MIYSKLTKKEVIEKARKARWKVEEAGSSLKFSRNYKDGKKEFSLVKTEEGWDYEN